MDQEADLRGGDAVHEPPVDESWRDSPRIPRKLIMNGKLFACSLDEYRQWQREHPELGLLRTPVLNGYVETVFDGEDRDEEVFRTYFVNGSMRELKGAASALLEVDESHGAAVRDVIKEWFAASSFPNEPALCQIPTERLLHGTTEKSPLFVEEHTEPLCLAAAAPASNEAPPRVMNSLRFRLMRALGRKPCTWYELRERLACDEKHALRTLELAWRDGLVVRREGQTNAEPPTLALSPKGAALFEAHKLSMVDQGCPNWEEDRHMGPAPEPWECWHCPLCGGPPMLTDSNRKRGKLVIGCARNPLRVSGSSACPAYWKAILRDGRLGLEIVGRGDVYIELDHRLDRTRVFVRSEKKSDVPGLIPKDKLLSKLKTYVVYS